MSNESDEEFYERFSKAVEEERERIEQKERKAKNGKADKETETQAQTLTKISTSGAALFHAPDGTGYADIFINGHRETWSIRSKGFRGWLTREFYKRDGAVPNSNALQAALALIEAIARFDGFEQKVFVRVASDNGKLYLDLADPGWNAIEIDGLGRGSSQSAIAGRHGVVAMTTKERNQCLRLKAAELLMHKPGTYLCGCTQSSGRNGSWCPADACAAMTPRRSLHGVVPHDNGLFPGIEQSWKLVR